MSDEKTVTRTLIVTVTVHEGTFPDEGALARQVESILTHRRFGLSVPAVTATEVAS